MSEHHDTNAPVDPLDEQLTAYLDGELDAVEARELEMRLARDAEARQRLRELAGAWDMLDNLPRTSVDQNFSRTTVALVVQEAVKEVEQLKNRSPLKARQRWIGTVAAIAAAIFVGFVGLNLLMPDPNQQLINEYTLIENWQLYREAGSLDFLEKLKAQKLFAPETSEEAANSTEFVSFEKNRDEVQSDLKKLEENERADLRRKYEELQKLAPDKIAQLRKFDAELRKRPDAEQLFHVMQSYYDWLTLRPPVESMQLSQLGTDERVNKTRELLAKSNNAADWFKQLAWVYRDEILSAEGENTKRWFNETRNDNRNEDRQKQYIARLFLKHLREDAPVKTDSILSKLTETQYSQLIEKLPDEARKQLTSHAITPQMSPEKKRETMQAGMKIASKSIDQVLNFNNFRRGPKDEDLKAFLDGMKVEQREKLLLDYPAVEDFNRELRKLYWMATWQQRGGPGGNRGGKGGFPPGQFRGDFGPGSGERGPIDRGPGGMRNGQSQRGEGPPRDGEQSGDQRRGGRRFGPPPGDRGPNDRGPGNPGKGEPPGFGPPPDDGSFGGPGGKDGPPPPRPPEEDNERFEKGPPLGEPHDVEKEKQSPRSSDSKTASN